MSLWDNVRQTVGNWADSLGTAAGLPETGLSERIAGGPTTNTNLGGLGTAKAYSEAPNSSQQPNGLFDQNGNQIGSSTTHQVVNTPTSTPTGGSSGGGGNVDQGRLGELKAIQKAGNLNPSQQTELQKMEEIINQGAGSQQDAAAAAAEARRRAAEAKYNAQKGIAEEAKGMAKEQYDWLVDTLGSNKKDLLEQVALQEKQGTADYALQETKTKTDYDKARQDILSTYRDLQTQQEKILRGSGMGSSSRSQEAALKLNNLLGKDISTVGTNEADSLAMIGNALTKFKENITQTSVSIEREAGSKLDKAALDYNQQVKSIDANMTLSAADREEAYAQAEAQLATDSQAITQWATGLKVQAQQSQLAMQDKLDGFVSDMLDTNGALNTNLNDKRVKTNDLITQLGFTPLDTNPTTTDPTGGVYQKAKMSYKDKDSLDAALQRGDITPADYQTQLQQIQMSSSKTSAVAAPTTLAGASVNPRGMSTSASKDPLLSALFA